MTESTAAVERDQRVIPSGAPPRRFRRDMIVNSASMLAVHLMCFAAIWTGVSTTDLILCFALYVIRMFGVTAGFHRYFSHRSYRMGRVPTFLMAILAQTSAQRGALWWAAHHRHHHKHSDQGVDRHSPLDGFWWSHIGWIVATENLPTDTDRIKDFARYPELRFLNRFHVIPAVILGSLCLAFFGFSGLVVGFCWSTVLLWHGTFTINSLTHVIGTRTYETDDDSRNHWLLALITLGEGWHNNHHHYQASTAQGFRWWEIDITYGILRMMSWTGIVSGVRRPPRHVVLDVPPPTALRLAAATPQANEPFEVPVARPVAAAIPVVIPVPEPEPEPVGVGVA